MEKKLQQHFDTFTHLIAFIQSLFTYSDMQVHSYKAFVLLSTLLAFTVFGRCPLQWRELCRAPVGLAQHTGPHVWLCCLLTQLLSH